MPERLSFEPDGGSRKFSRLLCVVEASNSANVLCSVEPVSVLASVVERSNRDSARLFESGTSTSSLKLEPTLAVIEESGTPSRLLSLLVFDSIVPLRRGLFSCNERVKVLLSS